MSQAPFIFTHLFQVDFFFLYLLAFRKEVTRVCWGMCSLEGSRLKSEQLESRPYCACQEPVFGTVDAQVLGMGLRGPRHCCLYLILLSSIIIML